MADITFDFTVNQITFDFTLAGTSTGGGSGTVTSVALSSALAQAFQITNPTTTPTLNIINASSPSTQFLSASGSWAVPAGSGGGGGTLTTVAVASANGFAGTGSSSGATSTLTLSTTITGLLKGNGTAISAASSVTDYQVPITLTTTGTSGPATLSNGMLNIPQYSGGGGSGTLNTVSVVSANGFAGTGMTTGTNAALTLSTSVTGIVKGNGAALSAAVAGTDYQAPITGNQSTVQQVYALGIGSTIGATASFTQLSYTSLSNLPNIPAASTTNPIASGTVAIGALTTFAKADHVHPFSVTANGSSGASTYDATTGILNVPQYAGGGGSSGTNWNTVANIAVGDQFMAATPIEVVPGVSGATAFDGSSGVAGNLQELKYTSSPSQSSGIFYDLGQVIANSRVFSTNAGGSWKSINNVYPNFSSGTGYGLGKAASVFILADSSGNGKYATTTDFVNFTSGTIAGATSTINAFFNLNNRLVAILANGNYFDSDLNTIAFGLVLGTISQSFGLGIFYIQNLYWFLAQGQNVKTAPSLNGPFTSLTTPGIGAVGIANTASFVFITYSDGLYRAPVATPTTFTLINSAIVNGYPVVANSALYVTTRLFFNKSTDNGASFTSTEITTYTADSATELYSRMGYSNSAFYAWIYISAASFASILRLPDLKSLYVYSPVNVVPQLAPNGTYKCLGASTTDYQTTAWWQRTA